MKYLLSTFILLAFIMSGCSTPERRCLNQADAIMEENPDSAMTILLSIDRNNIDARDLPLYSLLLTQALTKNDIEVQSDSLISIAYNKYRSSISGDKGIRSCFYMGEVLYNQEKYRDAMRYYLEAYEESKRLTNDYWRAKATERVGDLFFFAFNYKEAEKYRKEAIYYFGKSNKTINQRYMTAELANVRINQGKYKEALLLLDSLYDITTRETPNDSLLQVFIRRIRIDALISLDKIDELDNYDLEILNHPRSQVQSIDNKILSLKIKSIGNNSDIAEDITDILSSANTIEDKVMTLYACYEEMKKSSGNTVMIGLTDSLLYYQNSIAEKIISESVTGAERDFYEDMAMKKQREAKLHLIISIIIIILAGIASFFIYRYIKLKNISYKSELEAKVESLISMSAYSDKISAEKAALKKEIDEKLNTIATQTQLLADIKKVHSETNKDLDMMRNALIEKTELHRKQLDKLQQEYDDKCKSQNLIIESLLKKKWSTLNRLCEDYYEKGALSKFHELLIKEIDVEVRNIRSEEGLHQIEEEVDRYMNGIVKKLRNECLFLKERDFVFCALIFTGFSVKSICFILDITANNFYVRKKRMIQKISDSNVDDKELFLARLSNQCPTI